MIKYSTCPICKYERTVTSDNYDYVEFHRIAPCNECLKFAPCANCSKAPKSAARSVICDKCNGIYCWNCAGLDKLPDGLYWCTKCVGLSDRPNPPTVDQSEILIQLGHATLLALYDLPKVIKKLEKMGNQFLPILEEKRAERAAKIRYMRSLCSSYHENIIELCSDPEFPFPIVDESGHGLNNRNTAEEVEEKEKAPKRLKLSFKRPFGC